MPIVFFQAREPEKDPRLVKKTGKVRYDLNPKATQDILNLHCPICGAGVYDKQGYVRKKGYCPHLIYFMSDTLEDSYVSPNYKNIGKMVEEGADDQQVVEYLDKTVPILAFVIKGQYLFQDTYEHLVAVFTMSRIFGKWSEPKKGIKK